MTCIIIGAGNKGWTYSRYTTNYPEQMKKVGIADSMESHYIGFMAEESRHKGGEVKDL